MFKTRSYIYNFVHAFLICLHCFYSIAHDNVLLNMLGVPLPLSHNQFQCHFSGRRGGGAVALHLLSFKWMLVCLSFLSNAWCWKIVLSIWPSLSTVYYVQNTFHDNVWTCFISDRACKSIFFELLMDNMSHYGQTCTYVSLVLWLFDFQNFWTYCTFHTLIINGPCVRGGETNLAENPSCQPFS